MIAVSIEPLDPGDKQIEREWRRLETRASFFTSWDWVGTLLDVLPADCSLSLLRLSEQAETVGLAYLGHENALRHLVVRSRRIHLNSPGEPEFNCLGLEDNLLMARPDRESACWDAVLDRFAQGLADELVLPGLREPLDSSKVSRHELCSDNLAIRSYHVDLKRLDATDGRFADVLSRNARYQLRRSGRDYGGALELAEAGSPEEALAWFDNMKALHVASWMRRRKAHAFSRPFFEAFHRKLIQRTFSAGRIQMLRVTAGGGPIGYLYNFRDGDRTYTYQSGFEDKDGRLRPGAVSHALAIEHNFRLGVQTYDFLAGSNRLKSSFATDFRHMHWTTVQLPHMRFRLEKLARRIKHQIGNG